MKCLAPVIECLNPDHKYYICFDELDKGFSRSDNEYTRRLIGLLLAAKKVNNDAAAAAKRLNVIVFLRDDIYHHLKFEDKNKITENSSVLIQWDTEETKHTLKNLMARRFAEVLRIPEGGSWEQVFNEEQTMTGHQSKYRHIIDRTMLRPRDMIKFCNECLIPFKSQPQGAKIENVHVHKARAVYSEYLLAEIDDEAHKHIPSLDRCIELLRQLESVTFTKDEFQQICLDRKELIPDGYDWLTLLKELFEFSVLGCYAPGGKGFGGAQYVFRYKSPKVFFDPNAATYQVHLGLLEALNLKRYSKAA